jgi:hypothetical protein
MYAWKSSSPWEKGLPRSDRGWALRRVGRLRGASRSMAEEAAALMEKLRAVLKGGGPRD